MGPAPVTSTVRGSNQDRVPMRSTWSQALATTVVGSRSIPTSAEPRVQAYGVVVLDAPALAAVPVALLDPTLGVLAVAAHVELPAGAGAAGHRVGAAHHADDEVAGG